MYTVHQAKTNLSRLIEEAEKGKDVVIARGKHPVAKLIAINQPGTRRTPGKYKGRITIKSSFYEPITGDELKAWGFE